MAKTTLLTDNWSLGRVSDIAPNRMKPNTAQVMCNTVALDGTPLPVCSRTVLQRIVERLAEHGIDAKAAADSLSLR